MKREILAPRLTTSDLEIVSGTIGEKEEVVHEVNVKSASA